MLSHTVKQDFTFETSGGMRMLDVRRLTLLRELELRGSIAAVSRAMGISSPAISQQLAKLEAEVGLPLIEQVGRTVQLTRAGSELARRADDVIALLEEAESAMESRRSRVQGVVRLAAFSTFALRYLPDVLNRMAATHPDVVVEFTQVEPAEALEAVAGRRVDVAVTDEYRDIPHRVDPGMQRSLLLRDRIRAYTPRPVRSVAQLAALPWVFEPSDTDAAVWATRMCRDAGFEPQVRFESPDLRVHHGLVLMGVAAAFLPQMLFHSPSASLAEPPHAFAWSGAAEGLHREVYAVTRRGAHTRPAVAAVLAHLRHAVDAADLPSPHL